MQKDLNITIRMIRVADQPVVKMEMPLNLKTVVQTSLLLSAAIFLATGFVWIALILSLVLVTWLFASWVSHLFTYEIELDLTEEDTNDLIREIRLFE